QRSRQRAWADLSPPRQEDDVDGGGEHEWKSRSGTSGWGLARGSSSWAHGRTHGGHCSAESASRPVGLCLVRCIPARRPWSWRPGARAGGGHGHVLGRGGGRTNLCTRSLPAGVPEERSPGPWPWAHPRLGALSVKT
ncbi:unnamed protein product, partial [Prorocentrum cordatum]